MTRGTKITLVRLGPELLAEIEEDLRRRNHYTQAEPWTLSDWIRAAACERLAHGQRGRRRKAKGGQTDGE
jgi:hypothetical protein